MIRLVLVASVVGILPSLCAESRAHVGIHDSGPRLTGAAIPSTHHHRRAEHPSSARDTRAAATLATVEITLNRRLFESGQRLKVGLGVQNPVNAPPAELYFGALLADAQTVVFFSAPGVIGGTTTLDSLPELLPMLRMLPGTRLRAPTIFQAPLSGSDVPPGVYYLFAILLSEGTAVDPPAVLGFDVKSFTFLSPRPFDPSVGGQWDIDRLLPFVPIHLHLLPTGQVLMWPGNAVSGDDARLWDPATGAIVRAHALAGFDIFCSGHSFLADGGLLVAGGAPEGAPGEHVPDTGVPDAAIYDPIDNVWRSLPPMNAGRWYPTNTTLGNGDVLVTSGTIDLIIGPNPIPQVFEVSLGRWRDLLMATLELPEYPFMFLAPNGSVFAAGPDPVSRYLDTSGFGSWRVVSTQNFGVRGAGSSVIYDTGKVLVVGGGFPPTETAEVIDLTASSPSWRFAAPMSFARQTHNATLLPDGTVLVTGGTSGAEFNDPDLSVFTAELWDPTTDRWSLMSPARIPRLYHSAALLVPDGRVITTGGDYSGGYRELEVFAPPYLFKGPRPTLTAPSTVTYGENFFVPTPDAERIAQVTWLRLGSVTHGFNQNQRFNRLSFAVTEGGLLVDAPTNPSVVPPGHYILFILDGAGVPSVGQIVRIR